MYRRTRMDAARGATHVGATHVGATHLIAILLALMLAACDVTDSDPDGFERHTFSFEEDLEGWSADGTDLDDPPVDWSIERSTETASDGDASVRLRLDNLNDQGKIWLERSFQVERDQLYNIEISFDFATADWGMINLWSLIAGVHTETPEEAADLIFHPEESGHGEDEDLGLQWVQRSYTFEQMSDDDGVLIVAIGIWGTWEALRTYYVDDLRIEFTER